MAEIDNKYASGKIYQILNTETDDIYVGSTCMDLSDRLKFHKTAYPTKLGRKLYKLMDLIGAELFYIELVENFPCETKDELRKQEGHHIRLLGTLNMCVAGRTNQEYKTENKEHILEQGKEYYERTKEHKLEYQKSDKVKEWKSIKIDCPRGGSYSNCHKAEHFKCSKHKLYENVLINPELLVQQKHDS